MQIVSLRDNLYEVSGPIFLWDNVHDMSDPIF